MLPDLTVTAVGLIALLIGASIFVRSASTLAVWLGLSPVLVGATVVAFGTSAPEFLVSLRASVTDSGSLAVGSVLGSNVTNVAVVLGLAAFMRPLRFDRSLLRWELPVLVAGTIAFIVFGRSGTLGHIAGASLFLGLLVFIGWSVRVRPHVAAPGQQTEAAADSGLHTAAWAGTQLTLLAAGVLALAVGAYLAVLGATRVAHDVGMSDLAIGATVVAIGTSLPEVATSTVAAIRGEYEIAIANVVGSNIFNLLGVIGLASALGTLPVEASLYRFEIPALAASTAALVLLAWPRGRLGWIEGLVLLFAYVAFVAVVLVRGAN